MLSTCYASNAQLITPEEIEGFAQNPKAGIKALLDVKTIDPNNISMEEASQYFRSFEKFCEQAIKNGQKDYLSYLAAYPLRGTAFETIIKVQLNNLYFDEIIKSKDFKNKLKEHENRKREIILEKKIEELNAQINELNKTGKFSTRKIDPVSPEIVSEINAQTQKKPGKKSVRFSEEVENFPLVGDEKLEKSKTEWNEPDRGGNYKLKRDKTASMYAIDKKKQKQEDNKNALEDAIKLNPLDLQMRDESFSLHIEGGKEDKINKAVVEFCAKDNLSDSILFITNLVTGYEGDYVYLKKHQLSVIKEIVKNYLEKNKNIPLNDLKKLITLKVGGAGSYDKLFILIATLYEIQTKTNFINLSETEKTEFLSLLKSNLDKFETRFKGTVAGLMYKVLKLRLQPKPSDELKKSKGPVTKEVQDAVQYDPEFDEILRILDPDISLGEQFSEFDYRDNSPQADAIMKYLFEDRSSIEHKVNAAIAFCLESMSGETFNDYLKTLKDFVKCKNKFVNIEEQENFFAKFMKEFISQYIETFVNRFVPTNELIKEFHAENGSAWLINIFDGFKGKLDKMEKTEQVKKAIIELGKWEKNLPKSNREKYLETTRKISKERQDFFDQLNKEYAKSLETNGGRKDSKKQVKF